MKYYLTIIIAFFISFNTINAQNALRYANRMMSEFKYEKAIKSYESILKKSKSNPVILDLVECYQRTNDWGNAEKWCAKIVHSSNAAPDHIWNYVQLLQRNGKTEAAAEWSKKLLEDFKHHRNLFDATQNTTITQLKSANYYAVQSFLHNSKFDDFHPIRANNGLIFHTLKNDKTKAEHLHKGVFIPQWETTYTGVNIIEKPFYSKKESYKINQKRLYQRGDFAFSDNDAMTYFAECYTQNKENNYPVMVYQLYQSPTNQNGKNAVLLPFNHKKYSIIHPFMSGDTLYFASDMPDGFGGMDLYFTVFKNENWTKPQNLGEAINTAKDEIFPFFNKKTNQLYFTSNGHTGLGGLDIYYALPFDEVYKNNVPVNLGAPINSQYDDHGFIFYKKKHGYFASNRPNGKGGTDIYSCLKIKNEALPQPKKDKTKEIVNAPMATITWLSPKEDYSSIAKNHFNKKLKIELAINSNRDFFCTDIKIFVNNEEIKQGKSGDCGDNTEGSKKVKNGYLLNYEQTIEFSTKGNFNIVVKLYRFGEIIGESRMLKMNYKPQKINMHILAIGTSNKNLQYATNDAKDIVKTFKTQEKILYNKVYGRVQLNDDANASPISKGLNIFKNDYKNGQILSRDIVLIFISSHGYASENGTFYIQPNNFDKTDLEYSAIPFQIIKGRLDSLKCTKILIMDACHSGSELASSDKGDDENAEAARVLAELLKPRDSWVVMSSSGKEKSWESAKWQNGAFTEALLEGLSGLADVNNNGYISIEEWFGYAAKRANQLSTKEIGAPQRPQIYVEGDKIKGLDIFKY